MVGGPLGVVVLVADSCVVYSQLSPDELQKGAAGNWPEQRETAAKPAPGASARRAPPWPRLVTMQDRGMLLWACRCS